MKRLIPSIYLYKEKAIRNFKDQEVVSEDPAVLAKTYADNDADGLLVFDLSQGDDDHEKALNQMKAICTAVNIPVIGAGNVKRMEDIKKIIYTGCSQAVLNFDKEENIDITEEVSLKFGKDRICLSFTKPETLSVHRQLINSYISDTIWISGINTGMDVEYLNDPTIAVLNDCTLEGMIELFKKPVIDAISGYS